LFNVRFKALAFVAKKKQVCGLSRETKRRHKKGLRLDGK
jgi:hypothetical protein